MRVRTVTLLLLLLAALVGAAALAACGGSDGETTDDSSAAASEEPIKLKIAVTGAACEAPMYVAKDKGFFEKQGLDVELEMLGFDQIKVGLATGKTAAVVGNLEWIKPIEEGLELKFVQGLHYGCIEGVSPPDSGIESVADLKGKKVGHNGIGDYPDVLLRTALLREGLDPDKDVEIVAYPGADLPLALKKGEIDAFIFWDPVPSQYVAETGGNIWLDQSHTPPFDTWYCCMLVVPTAQTEETPEVTKKISAAVTEATEWIATHPAETAQVEVDGKWAAGTLEELTEQIGGYVFKPAGAKGRESLLTLTTALDELGILNEGTDPQELVERVYREDLSAVP